VKVVLCGSSVPVGKDMAIHAIHPPYAWDGHCSVVQALRHDSCLRGERERMDDYFCVAPSYKILTVKNGAKILYVWPLL
jgi:hypothetical protein